MLRSFENTNHTMGSAYTMFFLREYSDWVRSRFGEEDHSNSTHFGMADLKFWVGQTGSRLLWMSDMQWGNVSMNESAIWLKAFRFSVNKIRLIMFETQF